MRCIVLFPDEDFVERIENLDKSIYAEMVGLDFLEEEFVSKDPVVLDEEEETDTEEEKEEES